MMSMLDSLRFGQIHTRSRQTRRENRRVGRTAVMELQPSWDQFALTVVPANLTFTAVDKVRNSKAHNPRFTFIESGLVLGQTAKKVFQGTPALSTAATKHSPIGQYAIVVKQATLKLMNMNYTFKFINGVLQVAGKGSK